VIPHKRCLAYLNFLIPAPRILVQGDTATVGLGEPRFDAAGKMTRDHTLVLEPQQVLLDGKVRGKIPASATAIEVVCTNQTLSIVADRQLVLTAKMDK
jgi:hypothetical protein